jgi:hypothetical protein
MANVAWPEHVSATTWQWRRALPIAALSGLALGLLGPFNPSRPRVVAYWVGVMLLGELAFATMVRPAHMAARRTRLPVWLATGLAWLAMCAILSVACHAVAVRLWPDGPVGQISAPVWFAQTVLVAAMMAGGNMLATPGAPAGAARPPAAGFLGRLPPHLGRDLIALQMEDHYVRAHTSRGSALVLIPLRQALEELGDVPGLRVHRSWWVAKRAVSGAVQDGRNLRLTLSNGLEAPVSRANVALARDAGLIPESATAE